MTKLISFFMFLFSIILFSCAEKADEKKDSIISSIDKIYFDYKITGDAEYGDVTLLLQFKPFGEFSEPGLLANSSKVELDGKQIMPDSSAYIGFFYEIQMPIDSFSGKHEIVFTDVAGKQHKELFTFEPFFIKNGFPEKIYRHGTIVELESTEPITEMKVLLTDTALLSNTVSKTAALENGLLTFNESYFSTLSNGPIAVELINESEKEIKTAGGTSGKLLISYRFRGQSELLP